MAQGNSVVRQCISSGLQRTGVAAALLATGIAVAQDKSFEGVRFGVGISLVSPAGRDRSGVQEAEIDGNGFIRATKEAKRSPRVLLESHYMLSGPNSLPGMGGRAWGYGPFVAIETGGSDSTLSGYGIGGMLSFRRSEKADDLSSWNLGLGYIARTGVRVLGDGLKVNENLPANDKIRFKEITQPGWMLISSFSW